MKTIYKYKNESTSDLENEIMYLEAIINYLEYTNNVVPVGTPVRSNGVNYDDEGIYCVAEDAVDFNTMYGLDTPSLKVSKFKSTGKSAYVTNAVLDFYKSVCELRYKELDSRNKRRVLK